MKNFALWKYLLILAVVILGILFAVPNFFGESPIVQMQFASAEQAKEKSQNIAQKLSESGNKFTKWQLNDRSIEFYFTDTDKQVKARDWLKNNYPEVNIAINLKSNTPEMLSKWGLKPMNLGLDLRGGVSFLLQIDSQELFNRKSAELLELSKDTLKQKNIALLNSEEIDNGGVILWFSSADLRDEAIKALINLLNPNIERIVLNKNNQFALQLRYNETGINLEKRKAAEQNRQRIAGRVNSLGVAEPAIQIVGNDKILIELPGIQDVAAAKTLLGSTATLEFYLVDSNADLAKIASQKRAPFGKKLAYFADGTPIVLNRKVVMSGEHIIDAAAQYGHNSPSPQVSVVLDSAGGAMMNDLTAKNIGKLMATVYVEYLPKTIVENGKEKTIVEKKETVINSATIQGQFGSNFQITGVEPMSRAQELAATLRAGSLAAPVYIVQEKTIGPSAGAKNISEGIKASLSGLALVAIFILIYYRKLGLWAVIALSVNLILILACLSLIGATLTLPGIVGIVLTLGMAVDANVLIYERIREELKKIPVKEAVRSGFSNAFSTITDANITTLIVALLLFLFGSGPIKGFAVTLTIGVITSMFSAIYVTRALIEFFLLRKKDPKLKV